MPALLTWTRWLSRASCIDETASGCILSISSTQAIPPSARTSAPALRLHSVSPKSSETAAAVIPAAVAPFPEAYVDRGAIWSTYRRKVDFPEIRTYLDDDQRQKIFTNTEENGAEDRNELDAALVALIGWLYLGCREVGRDFDAILKTGVRRAEEERHDGPVEPTVTFEVKANPGHVSPERLAHNLEAENQVRARDIYEIPRFEDVPVDPDEVDVVRFSPENLSRPESEKEVVETISRTHLGIEVDVELAGVAAVMKAVEERDADEE